MWQRHTKHYQPQHGDYSPKKAKKLMQSQARRNGVGATCDVLARIIHEPGRFQLKPLIPYPFLDQVVKCAEELLLGIKSLKLLHFVNNQASLMNNPG